jgi:hypothetical protein
MKNIFLILFGGKDKKEKCSLQNKISSTNALNKSQKRPKMQSPTKDKSF